MDLRTLIGTLIEAADKHADTLHELCEIVGRRLQRAPRRLSGGTG